MSGSAAGATGAGAAAGSVLPGIGTLAGAFVGAGVGIFGAIKSANDQAEIERKKAALANEQADEILAREQINDAQIRDASFRSELETGSVSAAMGHTGGEIGAKLEIERRTNLEISLNDRAAAFQAKMLREGATLGQEAADTAKSAGYLQAGALGVSILGKALSPETGLIHYGKTQSLPSLPDYGSGVPNRSYLNPREL
jgi:hypothetical protein